MCDNFLESLKRCNITDHISIFVEDDYSAYHLGNRTDMEIKVMRPPKMEISSGFLRWGTDEYIKMVNRRPTYIRTVLEMGIDELSPDLDCG